MTRDVHAVRDTTGILKRLRLWSSLSPRWTKLVETYVSVDIACPGLRLITLAQWAVESHWATSELAAKHHNYAGLKYRPRMDGHAGLIEYKSRVDGHQVYCAFPDVRAFIRGYWHFIESGRYDGWRDYADDPVGYIRHLKRVGYAEDEEYIASVCYIHDGFCTDLRERPDSYPVLAEHVPAV